MACQRDSRRELLIVGAGSLGQVFAGLVARSGHPVLLVARPATAAQLRAQGAIRLRGVVDLDVPVAPAPAPAGSVGLASNATTASASAGAIFTTKGHQLPTAARDVLQTWHPGADAWVAGVQNGLAKDDMLSAVFGAERVVGAVTILGGQRQAAHVQVVSLGATFLGEFGGRRSERVEQAVALLTAATIPTEASGAIETVLWSKACNAAGVFGVSVLTRSSGRGMNSNPHLVRAYLALVRETAAVANAVGVALGDFPGFPIRTYLERSDDDTVEYLNTFIREHPLAPGEPEWYPSMTQDLLAGRRLEVDAVFGDLVERADRVGVEVPRLRLVRDLLRGTSELQPHQPAIERVIARP